MATSTFVEPAEQRAAVEPEGDRMPRERRQPRVGVLMLGSREYHGEHAPLDTDTLIATSLGRALAQAYDLELHHVFPITCSHEHAAQPGTVSISERQLSELLEIALEDLNRKDVDLALVIYGHGGNHVAKNVLQRRNVDRPRIALFPSSEDWKDAERAAELATTAHEDMHAGEREMSLLLHWHPDRVDPRAFPPDHLVDDRRHLLTLGMRHYAPGGYIGRPRQATAEKGAALERAFLRLAAEPIALLRSPSRQITTLRPARRAHLAQLAGLSSRSSSV